MGTRHLKKLYDSDEGHISLLSAIAERLEVVKSTHLRLRGTDLVMPPSLQTDMKRVQTLVARYMQGDMRHSRSELMSAQAIAQWTVDVICELRKQPRKEVRWMDQDFKN